MTLCQLLNTACQFAIMEELLAGRGFSTDPAADKGHIQTPKWSRGL